MWEKVRGYLDDPSSYTSAPGVTNKSCMLVKSASGTKPHFVQRSGKSKYKCDGDCLMFKSTNGICSHKHLGAALNDEVSLFICNYSKCKAPINYAQLAQHGLPLGGRKHIYMLDIFSTCCCVNSCIHLCSGGKLLSSLDNILT